MTKIIGLTGGIGSGKSTVAKEFAKLGVPVYIADDAAKIVMQDPKVVSQIADAFPDVVANNYIDRPQLAKIVFSDPEKLKLLNDIVHPAVKAHFSEWLLRQNYPFVIREAAILFESGSYVDCDMIITIVAPIEDRIERVIRRDNTTRESVIERIDNQWTDEQRIAKSDFVIQNIDRDKVAEEIIGIFNKLINL